MRMLGQTRGGGGGVKRHHPPACLELKEVMKNIAMIRKFYYVPFLI